MKNNKTTKGNKRPIKKLIALWVVFAMLVVPFASYVGDKEGAKADAGAGTLAVESGYEQDINDSISLDVTTNGEDIVYDTETKNVNLRKGAQKYSFTATISTLNGVAYSSGLTLKYKEYTAGDTPTSVLSAVELTELSGAVSVTESKTYGIYVSNNDNNYVLQYVINVTYKESAFTSDAGIYYNAGSGEAKQTNDSFVGTSTMKSGDSTVFRNAVVKYYVKDTGAATVDEQKNVEKYSTETSISVETYAGKQVYAYAALVSEESTPRVLEYKELGYVNVSNDTTDPVVTCTNVAYLSDNTDPSNPVYSSIESAYTNSGTNTYLGTDTYYGVSDKYKYTLSIADGVADDQTASGIQSVSAKFVDDNTPVTITETSIGSGEYVIELPKENAGRQIRVSAKDKIGREKTLDLMKIVQVTESTTVTSAKIQNDERWDGLGTTEKYINAQKTLEVKLSSTASIEAVRLVYDSTNQVIESASCGAGTVLPNRTKDITATFKVPAYTTSSIKLEDIKVQIQKTNSATFETVTGANIADIIYDITPPAITTFYIQKSTNGGTTWLPEPIAGTGEVLITELDAKYRYVVVASDDNLEGVSYSDGSATGSMTYDSTLGAYVLAVPDDLSASSPYTLSVTATDKAGNPSETKTFRDIKKYDDSFVIKDFVIKDGLDDSANDVTENFASGKTTYLKKKHKISVTAESVYEIDEVKLYSYEYPYPGGQSPIETTIDNTQDPTTHRYKATVSFVIPAGTDVNSVLNSMYIIAKDAKRPTANEVRYPSTDGTFIGNILYDQTEPTHTISETIDTAWHKDFSLGYTITSGGSANESPLKNGTVRYILADCTNNVTDGQITVDGTQTTVSNTQTFLIPQSTSIEGTYLRFEAQDVCENTLPANGYRIKVDGEEPKITLFDVNEKTILSNALEGDVTIRANVSDNLTIASATIQVVGPDGINVTKSLCDAGERVGIGKDNSFTLDGLLGKKAPDGQYTVTVKVSDKAGNAATDRTISFTVDNTIPVVTAKIAGGTTAGKQPGTNFDGTVCDYFYRSNVPVVLTYEDDNLAASGVTVTDNGNKLNLTWARIGDTNKYQATYTATQEGPHTVKITAKDDAGNDAVAKQVVFIKDITAPTITAVLNGGIVYSEGMGEVDLTSAASLNLSVNDKNEDAQDFHYQLVKTAPDTLPVTADYIKTDNRTFAFADEADYLVNAYAIDKAGNRGPIKSVLFRVDTTAPEIKISGAASGSSLNAGTTLTFTMTEAFWKDASGTVTITRKAGDGASESTYKTIDFKPTARTTNISESLTETGEYKVTFTAKDRAGHTSEAATYTVKIDKDKPVITLNGVANNDKTTGEVEFLAQIEDDFYLTKAISIKATRTYLDETTYQEKTEDIKFTGYNAAASDTIIRDTFKEDGFYKIQITCKDAAGNEDTQEVSFTIDKSKPIIDSKVLGAYEGTLTAFAWDYDISDLVYDLTVCDVHMYLNGSEYDGTSEIEDGAYEMKITAEDELGNYVEQIVNFTLDTKAPTFIVTGVEDGEVKNEQYTIEVSLQLDEDVLDSVSLNGSAVEVKDNKASLTVSDKGDYELTMKAHDAAGNEAEKTIRFTYGEKSMWWIYLIIGIAAVLGIGGVIFVVVRKKK